MRAKPGGSDFHRQLLPQVRHHISPMYWWWQGVVRRLLGTSIDERRFRQRGRVEIQATLTNVSLPHRQWLADRLLALPDVTEILEIGCGWGANLEVLAMRAPSLRLTGIDINSTSIEEGRARFVSCGLDQIRLLEGQADRLEQLESGAADVVFTDAVLLYIGPDKIEICIQEMRRIARRAVVLLEMHLDGAGTDGSYTRDGWVRDYSLLCRRILGNRVNISRMPPEMRPAGRWPKYGSLIEVSLHN
jgi:SAM-dependent methyltransferase